VQGGPTGTSRSQIPNRELSDGVDYLVYSVNDFIAHLDLTAASIKQSRADQARERLERAEAERRRWEEAQRRQEEAEREKRFEEKLECWRLARDAREYVREARTLVSAANRTIEEGSSLDESLKWAESYAERVDPLARIREQLSRSSGLAANDEDAGGDASETAGGGDRDR
jgi:hypothetical protein